MHDAAGNQRLTTQSVLHIRAQLTNPSSAMIDAIGTGIGSKRLDPSTLQPKRQTVLRVLAKAPGRSETLMRRAAWTAATRCGHATIPTMHDRACAAAWDRGVGSVA
jgi:hypothetical protein